MKFWFNPLTSRFEVKDSTGSSTGDTITINCDSSLNVGDLVVQSLSFDNKVEKCVNNTTITPCIGIVVSKDSSTICKIKQTGTYNGFSGLIKGQHVFLSLTGTPTSSIPATGYLQILGTALSATELLISIQILRVKRAT